MAGSLEMVASTIERQVGSRSGSGTHDGGLRVADERSEVRATEALG
jgi:hypothetical protein